MKIDIITLFPEMFGGPFGHSIIKRACDKSLLEIELHQLRDFTYDKHRIVDDYSFGGGAGMVMKPEPFFRAITHIAERSVVKHRRVLLMCPGGRRFDQDKCKELAGYEQLVFICGHYEGIDARVGQVLADEAISIGDYVLTGGELPAMVIVDAVARLLPDVLGSADSAPQDSFYHGLLEYPQYTRPREFDGYEVPDILLSGDHAKIERWRRKQALKITSERRPDLMDKAQLNIEDEKLLREIAAERAEGE